MMIRVFPFFLLAIIFSGCKSSSDTRATDQLSTGKLNGLHQYYYPNGKLYMEVTFKDSIPHGVTRQYFENGQLFDETSYHEGIPHGIAKKFYEDGKLSKEVPYDSGRVHGLEKKFRKDGTQAYEAPYHYGSPCVGLKEFYLDGSPRTKFPQIVITPIDKMFRESRYLVKLSLSEPASVEFYRGQLTDGKYIGSKAQKLYAERDGTSSVEYYVGPGEFVMETFNIIAKIKTDLDNYYITQRSYRVAVQNR